MSATHRTLDDLEPYTGSEGVRPAGRSGTSSRPPDDILIDLRDGPRVPHAARAPSDSTRRLMRRYQRMTLLADAVAAAAASTLATVLRFQRLEEPTYLWLLLVVPVVWCVLIAAKRGYEQRFLGRGPEEYRRVWEAALLLFITTAVLSFSLKGDVARGYTFLVVPLVLALTVVSRAVLRAWVGGLRTRGLGIQKVLVVGPSREAHALSRRLEHGSVQGLVPWRVLPKSAGAGLDQVLRAVDESHPHVVAVVPDPDLSGQTLRALSWELEERGVDLVVDPGLVDVAGARLSIHPVADLSLLHVQGSRPSGERMLAKSLFDRVLAGLLLIVLSPLLLAVAAAVKLTTKGPVLFRQTRVGVKGRTFAMLKFRSMVVDADRMVAELRAGNEGNEVLFKLKQDPRVTRIGAVLRRYSLDELPQLINVVRGEMSLVGPRPPLPCEVDSYDYVAVRRLRLRPGLTGLWQVSGRSDLSWEESLRLDLRYVDNWSMALDLHILVRTWRAVFSGAGAY
jgi:exopolysaccharide biosynthesis polyprenyl glycosylphosphotransferase